MVSKIVQVFLFPPGLFVLLTAAGSVLFLVKKRTAAIVLLSLSLGSMYLLSTGPVSTLLLLPLEQSSRPYGMEAGTHPRDLPVVVLGGGSVPRSPDESGKGSPSPDALKRLIYGIRLSKRTGGTLVVSGGTVYPRAGAEPEAYVSKRIALDLGIPETSIIAEIESRNTWENAAETRSILPDTEKIILVTSAYHMKRSVNCFEARGFTVIPAPTDYKIDRTGFTPTHYLPSMGSLEGSAAALREYWGLLYYGLRYY